MLQTKLMDGVPSVSVLMPVRDAALFLDAAIDAIRAQTMRSFELLLVDGGSRDDSLAIMRRHAAADPRLRVLPGAGLGVAAALNLAIVVARAPLLARMDADDLTAPDRLTRQAAVMADRPGLAVLGTGFTWIDAAGVTIGSYVPTIAPDQLRHGLLLSNRIAHPTAMMRRDAVQTTGGYRSQFRVCEDYDLWLRLSEQYDLSNLPDLLLSHRVHPEQATARAGTRLLLESLAARHAARMRRAGRPDPLANLLRIEADTLLAIGVPRLAIEAASVGRPDLALETPPRQRGVRTLLRDALEGMRERDAMGPGGRFPRLAATACTPAGRERIFVMMPAYRDTETQWTIRDAFAQAADPDRIAVGVVWQIDPQVDGACFTAITRPDQVRSLCFDYREARGCSWARNQGMRLWDGEGWLLQIDSHMRFVPGWDRRMLAQIAACGVTRALLTNRPPHYDLPDGRHPDVFSAMTADRFDDRGVLFFGARVMDAPATPRRTAFCGGGFIFGPAERAVEVPFDPHIYFVGEEPNLAVRLWTHGWELFCPNDMLIYHHYGAGGPGRRHSWGEVRRSQRLHERTMQRMDHLLGIRRTRHMSALTDLGRYGLGTARSLAQYESFAGVRFRTRHIEPRARAGDVLVPR